MRVLAILSEKGGAGKTTLAVHIATAHAWAERRSEPPEAEAITPVALPGRVGKLADSGAELVVLDTGRDANNAGYTAARAADLILIPLRTGGFDFIALARTLDLCKLAGKRPFIVMNAMRPGAARVEADLREALAPLDCEIAPVIIHERADYRAASVAAKSAQELDPKGKAVAEIAALYAWLGRQFALSNTQQKELAK